MSAPLVLPGPHALAALIAGRSPTEITIADDDPLSGIVQIVANANGSGRRDIFVQVCGQRADGAQLVDQVLRIDPNAAPAPPSRFTLLTVEDIQASPDPEWLADGWLTVGGLSCLYGASGTSKSFNALDLAFSVASGTEWLGSVPTKAGAVVYVLSEGGTGGLKLRQQAYLAVHRGIDTSRLRFLVTGLNLLEPDDALELNRAIQATCPNPALVIIDTLARSMVGGDENTSRDMGRAIASADMIRAANGCHVMLVHHSGRNGDHARGSNSLHAALDTEISQSREGSRVMQVECTKQRDGETGAKLTVQLVPVNDTKSCVLDPLVTATGALAVTEQTALRALYDYFPVSHGAATTEWANASELAERTFFRAHTALLARGYVFQLKKRSPNTITAKGCEALGVPPPDPVTATANLLPPNCHGSSQKGERVTAATTTTLTKGGGGSNSAAGSTPATGRPRSLPYKDDDDAC